LPVVNVDLTFRSLEENFAATVFIGAFSVLHVCVRVYTRREFEFIPRLNFGISPDNASFVLFKRAECPVCALSDSARLPSAIF